MRINCDIVQDLIPMYEDDICSDSSREAVEFHLKTCEKCRALKNSVEQLDNIDYQVDVSEADINAVSGIKRIRRHLMRNIAIVILLIPIIAMSVCQVLGTGLCFTNIDDIVLSIKYVKALQEKDFRKATELYNFEKQYEELYGNTSNLDMTTEEYCNFMEKEYPLVLEEVLGESEITNYYIWNTCWTSVEGGWQINIQVAGNINGQTFDLTLIPFTEHGKIRGMGGSYLMDNPLNETVFRAISPRVWDY